MALLVAALLLLLPAPSLAAPSSSAPPVDQLFQQWAEAVASGEPRQVAGLYAPDAVLLPTLSPRSRSTPAAVSDYFEAFLARRPRAELVDRQLVAGGNPLVTAGLYRFQFHDSQGGEALARFTFVYRHDGARWWIVHHHSSLLPA